MKSKNIMMMVIALCSVQYATATVLEVANNTGTFVDIQPIISLSGKDSLGKRFSNVPNGQTVSYNSGIYKITGFFIRTITPSPNGNVRTYQELELRSNFPIISTTNLTGKLGLGIFNVCFFYPNKKDILQGVALVPDVAYQYKAILDGREWKFSPKQKVVIEPLD